MKIIIIGNNTFSNKLAKKFQENNFEIEIFENNNIPDLKENIIKKNIDYIINLSHKKNINYFSKDFKDSEIVFYNLKMDIEIAEICMRNNIKLVYFENVNRQENTFITNIYKIYSEENNLKVNIIKSGDILDDEITNNLNTIQYISKFIINSQKEYINYENIDKNLFLNIESEMDIIKDFDNFKENYNIIDYTEDKVSLVDITQNIINISNKNIKILDQNNIYKNDKEILYIKNYLQKTFYNFEIENKINELELTQEDIDKMNDILDKFDKSNNGELDIEELNNVFICMGINLNFQSLMEIFKKSDINKDGKINKQEFIILMKKNIFSKTQNNNHNDNNIDYNDLKIEG